MTDIRIPDSTLTTVEVSKEYLSFSAAHFTIFSASARERLHGHNWRLACAVTMPVGADGLGFDYAVLKRLAKALCDRLDERLLLPGLSPHLRIESAAGRTRAWFAGDYLDVPSDEVLVLGVRNVTVEDLAAWFLEALVAAPELAGQPIVRVMAQVSSGPGQSATVERTLDGR